MNSDSTMAVPPVWKLLTCCSCQKNFNRRLMNAQPLIKCYGIQEQKTMNSSYLLSCGHSLCEGCCQNIKTNAIFCGTCGSVTELPSVKNPKLSLPRNAYLEGKISLEKSLLNMDNISYKISMKPNKSQKTIDTSYFSQNLGYCYECSYANATKTCQQCGCNFCDPCWTKVHSSGKSLQKHIPTTKNSLNWSCTEHCKIHEGKVLEFFCRECKIYACPLCIVLNHQGGNHKPVTLQERNSELFGDVDKLKEEVNKNMKKMIDTSKEVKAMRDVSCGEASHENLLRQVVHNFAHLHGVLQVAEESVLKMLDASEKAKRNRLEEMLLQLDRQIETVKFVLGKVDGVKNAERCERDVLFEGILDTLKKLKDLPSRLVRSEDSGKNGASEKKPILSFDESIVERLQKYCTVNIPESDDFELTSGSSDDVVLHFSKSPRLEEGMFCQQEENEESDKSKNSNCSDDSKKLMYNTYMIKSLSQPLRVLPVPKTKLLNIVEGHAYPVCISYVKDPGEFYVMRSCFRKRRQKVDLMTLTFASKVHAPPKKVEKDEYYLVQYAVDNKWYRGRVVDVLPRKNENNETVAVIYYLDYGNKQEVPLSRMRDMPKSLHEEPPLAIKCKLFGCVPRKGNWCKGSTKVMLDVLDSSVMTMYVMKVHPDCLEVDLSRRGSDDSIDHELISLRDMLVFLEYASLAARNEEGKKRNTLKYLKPAVPKEDSFRGLITHVESESLFYVQKIGPDTQYLLSLMDKLDNTYNKGNVKGLIYNPDLDMPCAALYPQDGKWYRGEIIDFPGHEQLTVHYVDYGNKETVHWKSVRKLHPEFLKLVPQAIPCSLEIPLQSQLKWKPDVKERLESYSSEILSVIVVGKKNGKLTVVLHGNKNASISNEMMEDSTNLEEERDCSKVFGSVADDKNRKRKEGSKNEVSAYEELPKFSDDVFRTEVQVLQASSPSDIYVSLVCFSVRTEEWEKELQRFYAESQPNTDAKWEVGDKCAALSTRRRKWCRAIIAEILNDRMRVVLKDIMETEEIPVLNIRMLDERFFAYPAAAIKCHLAGVFPPETEWPGLSCEFLKSQLDSCKHVYMTKMGEIENNSLPVQLWVKRRIQGGALEPTTEEWVMLNDLIVQQGLAVPKLAKLLRHAVGEEKAKPITTEPDELKAVKSVDDVGETEDSVIPPLTSDWPPPKPCLKDSFMGETTYVGTDGVMYIHDEEDKPILEELRLSLLEQYGDSKPHAHDQYWSEGQLCIARYHLDSGWYRGKVLKVNEDSTYEVMFADYGNVETCKITEMRKNVKHLNVPIVTRKFVLYGVAPVSPDGRWPISVTDYIHSSLVEKRCYVTVVEKSEENPSKIRIQLCGENFDMGENLVGMGLAKFNNVGKEEEEEKPIKKYSNLELPMDFKTFPIEVVIVKYSEFFVHILDHESIPAGVRKVILDFVALTNEIQCEAEKQKNVKDFRQGTPCISLYSDNGTWYRAEILRCDNSQNLVLVRYVDYGNEEYVTKDRCLTKWFNVPKMVLNMRLYNVRMKSGIQKSVYLESLSNCLARPGLTAEIIQGNELVHFVEVKKDGVLAYQEMIDKGLMELILSPETVPMDESLQYS